MNMLHFQQLISDFTRICPSSATIKDLILVSYVDKISQHGVINTCFSDHSLIYCTRNTQTMLFGKHNTVSVRSLKNYNKDDFQNMLLSADWTPVLISDNVCITWDTFKSMFLRIIDTLAPVKQIRTKQRTEPWITSDIL